VVAEARKVEAEDSRYREEIVREAPRAAGSRKDTR